MSGPDPSDPGLDDWFDEPQPRAGGSAETTHARDDWLESVETRSERRSVPRVGARVDRRALIAVAAALLLLLIGLAAGGVFSGGSSTPTPATSATTAPTTSPAATTNPASPAGPTTTLKPGSRGAQVRALQRALASLGYSPGKIDGQYGPGTQKALAGFQRASKLTPDGILGPKSLAALRKAAASG